MRTNRPLRLEALEDRFVLTDVTGILVTDPTLLAAALAAAQPTPTPTPITTDPNSGAYIGLIVPVGTTGPIQTAGTTTPTPPADTIVVINPIGTPVNP